MKIRTPLFEQAGGSGDGQGGSGGGGTPTIMAAVTPAPVATPAAPVAALAPSDWIVEGKFAKGFSSRLPDDMKEHASTMQKFEDVPLQDVLKSYGALQQKLGQRVQAPLPDAKPEEIAAWRKVTGAPETAEGYKIEKPADMPAEQWNPELARGFSEMAHKHHLSPAAAADLVQWWNGQQAEAMAQTQGYVQEYRDTAELSLKKDWGDKFEANAKAAQRVAGMAGLDVNDPAIGNNPAVIRALHSMSNLISDDKQITGAGVQGIGLSRGQEADDIQRNPANPFHADYHGKNGSERQKQAQDRMMKLRMLGAS